jgi:hypothetical protein
MVDMRKVMRAMIPLPQLARMVTPEQMLAWYEKNVTHKWVLVTPALAKHWLETRNRKIGNLVNRKRVPQRVDRYARLMTDREWFGPTGEPIIFDCDGNLVEAQHRLEAIMKSGVTDVFLIVEGVSKVAFKVIGTGMPHRTQDDLLNIHGYDFGLGSAAILKMAYTGLGLRRYGKRWNSDELVKLARRFWDAMKFVQDIFGTRKYLHSVTIKSVVVRAYYSRSKRDLPKLRRFCKILQDGIFDGKIPEEFTVHSLREWLLNAKGGRPGYGRGQLSTETKDVYARVSRHLHSYLEGQVASSCRKATYELFPLPEETAVEEKSGKNGTRLWFIPLSQGRLKAFVKDFRGRIVLKKEGLSKKVRPGDKVCFCAEGGTVADAVIKDFRVGGSTCEAVLQAGRQYRDMSIMITPKLCKKLDVCRNGKYNPLSPNLLLQGMRPVSPRDFAILTGGHP